MIVATLAYCSVSIAARRRPVGYSRGTLLLLPILGRLGGVLRRVDGRVVDGLDQEIDERRQQRAQHRPEPVDPVVRKGARHDGGPERARWVERRARVRDSPIEVKCTRQQAMYRKCEYDLSDRKSVLRQMANEQAQPDPHGRQERAAVFLAREHKDGQDQLGR